MSGRDVLHRLVDELDEEDAALLASIVEEEQNGAARSEAPEALRSWLQRLDRKGFAVLSVAVLRDQVTAALTAWRETQAEAEQARRKQVVADALGSVKLEGLEPSDKAHQIAAKYVAGQISAKEFYAETLRHMRALHNDRSR